MNDFRRKHTNPIFVVSSDDKEWIQEMFQNMTDVVLTPRYQTRKHGELDMAILAQCNHSIIRYLFALSYALLMMLACFLALERSASGRLI